MVCRDAWLAWLAWLEWLGWCVDSFGSGFVIDRQSRSGGETMGLFDECSAQLCGRGNKLQ